MPMPCYELKSWFIKFFFICLCNCHSWAVQHICTPRNSFWAENQKIWHPLEEAILTFLRVSGLELFKRRSSLQNLWRGANFLLRSIRQFQKDMKNFLTRDRRLLHTQTAWFCCPCFTVCSFSSEWSDDVCSAKVELDLICRRKLFWSHLHQCHQIVLFWDATTCIVSKKEEENERWPWSKFLPMAHRRASSPSAFSYSHISYGFLDPAFTVSFAVMWSVWCIVMKHR